MPNSKDTPARRSADKHFVKFDFTINLPLIITLLVGFVSLAGIIVKGYYDHEARIAKLEISASDIERSAVVVKQGVILEQIQQLKVQNETQINATEKRLDRLEDKLDRVIEGRKK